MLKLPYEIVSSITQYFHSPRDFFSFMYTCKDFYNYFFGRIHSRDYLPNSVPFVLFCVYGHNNPYFIRRQKRRKVHSKLHFVQKLLLDGHQRFTSECFKYFPNLKVLTLHGCEQVKDEGFENISKHVHTLDISLIPNVTSSIMRYLKKLRILFIDQCYSMYVGTEEDGGDFKFLTDLREISVSKDYSLGSNIFQHFPELLSLSIILCNGFHISRSLRELGNLQSLSVDGCKNFYNYQSVEGHGFENDWLETFSATLKKLSITNNYWMGSDIVELYPKLEHLHIDDMVTYRFRKTMTHVHTAVLHMDRITYNPPNFMIDIQRAMPNVENLEIFQRGRYNYDINIINAANVIPKETVFEKLKTLKINARMFTLSDIKKMCPSVIELVLTPLGGFIPGNVSNPVTVTYESVKRLIINDPVIGLRATTMRFDSFPNLQQLSLFKCFGVRISKKMTTNFAKLRELSLYEVNERKHNQKKFVTTHMLEHCPNLVSLSFDGTFHFAHVSHFKWIPNILYLRIDQHDVVTEKILHYFPKIYSLIIVNCLMFKKLGNGWRSRLKNLKEFNVTFKSEKPVKK